jgi:glutathione S-transferase
VRKLLVVLDLKAIPYRIDPVIPFSGNDEFSRVSPLRRVPVYRDDAVTLSDSTVICEYLEERYPTPALMPQSPAARARARWLEEFADTRMGEVFIWRLFNQTVIGPYVWGTATDKALLERTLTEEIPHVLDYLERELPNEGFLFGALSIADVSIAVFFRNAAFARFQVDAARWPKTAGFVARVLALPSFLKLAPFEEKCLRTPWREHRAAVGALGAPLTESTFATGEPRRGLMQI